MKNGGYVIIDFSGVNFTENTPVNIPGIYKMIDGGSKPIVISGLVFNEIKYRDRFVSPENIGVEYVIPISDVRYMSGSAELTQMHAALWLEITAQDNVTPRYWEG